MTSVSGPAALDHQDANLAEALSQSALALASRFSGGATLWCVAPGRRDHALHVAVEFVHPAIVGKPALPAVEVSEPALIASLRSCVRSGDAVLCIGPGNNPTILDIVRRVPAWGAETIWIGWGLRPPTGSAVRPIWLADEQDSAMVRAYHLLWELTHVCLEQTATLSPGKPSADSSCPACADQLVLGEVVSAGDGGVASVRTALGMETVDTSLIETVAINDLVLTQGGVALQVLDDLTRNEADNE